MLGTSATSVLALLACAGLARAHGHIVSWTIGGQDLPGFDPSNPTSGPSTAERPTDNNNQGFADYTSPIVACGGLNAGTGLLTYDVQAGSSVTANWDQWPADHIGSVTEFMARCPGSSCDGVDAASLDWFKIAEETWDGTQWPTERISQTKSYAFTVPSDLAAGPYLIRHNLIALHSIGAPQVYPVCIQANLVSSGSTVPTDTVKFPEAYNTNDMFKTFNVWTADPATFVPPGPPVYNGGGSAPAPAPVPSTGPSPSGSPSVSPSVDPVPVPTGAGGNGAAVPTTDAFPAPAPTTDAAPVVSTDVAPVPSVVPTPAPAPAPVPTRSCKRKRRSLVY